MPSCREFIVSENVIDIIGRYNINDVDTGEKIEESCSQIVDDKYVILYEEAGENPEAQFKDFSYANIPKLYGLMDTTAVADTGAIRLQSLPSLNLTGRDVIVGFIDTGIDYLRDEFRYSSGQTRIIGIWDQTDESGNIPDGFKFGSEYTREDINRALESDEPFEIVPSKDEIGHGTFMASIACGSLNEQQDFIGVAPGSLIAMVKLKQAKQYLRDFYFIEGDEPVYQENDIMLAVAYLRSLQNKFNKPLVYVIGLGSGSGARTGGSPLSNVLSNFGNIIGNCVVVCSGNEGNARLHYEGVLEDGGVEDVELRVGDNDPGFVLELWGSAPDIFSIAFVSPLGESVARIPAKKGATEKINFLIEGTRIEVGYALVESGNGGELIFLRFVNPSPGIWILRIYGNNILSGKYNIWGNLREFSNPDTYFLKPNPEITLTGPSASDGVLTVGGYDHLSNAIYPASGRGFAVDNNIKPDIVAPAVNVFGADICREGFIRRTGTSVATALTAGCCAQMLEWGIINGNETYMKTNLIKNYLIRGAKRDRDILYPSRQWGYGKLDVYNSFVILTTV